MTAAGLRRIAEPQPRGHDGFEGAGSLGRLSLAVEAGIHIALEAGEREQSKLAADLLFVHPTR